MIDSHCHLAGTEFADDLDAVVDRARAAGVTGALVILAADEEAEIERSHRVLALWPECRVAVGVHPHQAHRFAADPTAAARLVDSRLDSLPGARAVGEIGLDYHYDFSPPEVQQAVFRAQLDVARRRSLPVVIHMREAEDDTLRILAERGGVETRGVFHCFSGDAAAASRVLATGYYVSIPGIATFPKAQVLRDAAAAIPADRLLVETDSPYLAPVPFRGRRNEPAFVAHLVAALAAVRATSAAELGAQTAENFAQLFRP
jgi:TatD DNase family protein